MHIAPARAHGSPTHRAEGALRGHEQGATTSFVVRTIVAIAIVPAAAAAREVVVHVGARGTRVVVIVTRRGGHPVVASTTIGVAVPATAPAVMAVPTWPAVPGPNLVGIVPQAAAHVAHTTASAAATDAGARPGAAASATVVVVVSRVVQVVVGAAGRRVLVEAGVLHAARLVQTTAATASVAVGVAAATIAIATAHVVHVTIVVRLHAAAAGGTPRAVAAITPALVGDIAAGTATVVPAASPTAAVAA